MRWSLATLLASVAVAVGALLVLVPAIPNGPVEVPLTPAVEEATPVPVVGKAGGSGQVLAVVPLSLRDVPGTVLELRIATYLRAPTADVVVELLDSAGATTTRCRFPHASYRDALPVDCLRSGRRRVVRLRVSARGSDGELAVLGNRTSAGYHVGRWFERASGVSVEERVGFAAGAIEALRPAPFRTPLLALALVLAGALIGAVTWQTLAARERE